MPTVRPEYNAREYRDRLAWLKANWRICEWCGLNRATSPDHEPALCHSLPGAWKGRLVNACRRCNLRRGGSVRAKAEPWRSSRQW